MTPELIFGILLAGLLSDNYALLHFLGTGAVIENERTTGKSLIIGLGTTIVMVLSTLITWPINTYLLAGATYLRTLVFVCVIMLVVELVHVFAKKKLENAMQSTLNVHANVRFVEYGSLPRSEGKAKRVIDNRKK
jgi:Na+-translocating ferredoxin:NAD+ oxidoreductase RnfA subunit